MSGSRSGRGSSSHGGREWPTYGPVPLILCPYCRRFQLVRRITKSSENGNLGREYVKCQGNTLKGIRTCSFYMWLDEYMEKLPSMMTGAAALEEVDSRKTSEVAKSDGMNTSELDKFNMFAAELKSMNANLTKIIDLQQQENYMLRALCVSLIIGLPLIIMGVIFLMSNPGCK